MIIHETLDTPVRGECDVLVAGGGIAGIAAALAAARQGARVTLLEAQFALGGLATLGLVTIYLPLCDGRGHQVIYGIGEELLRLSILHGAEENTYPAAWLDGGSFAERAEGKRFRVQYNPSLFAFDAERLLREHGVEVLYGCRAVAVHQTDGRIDAVMLEGKGGREAITVHGAVVDATGDADIAALSGAPTAVYAPGNKLAGWYYYLRDGQRRLKMQGQLELSDEEKAAVAQSQAEINISFSGLDTRELSEMVCRSHQSTMRDFLGRCTGNPAEDLTATTAIPQVRMTRRIVGTAAPDIANDGLEREDCIGLTGNWRRRGPIYALPYGSIAACGVRNLFAAGRCISVTDALWDITRVIPTCAVTGEAAGVAAAMLCTQTTPDSATLPIGELQAKLRQGGVRLRIADVR